jgi:hypothetical protein
MNEEKTCIAIFELVPAGSYTLNINNLGFGTVISDDSSINCGSICEAVYNQNTTVTLRANPDTGYIFDSWDGDCSHCNTNTTCQVVITGNKSCIASFKPITSSDYWIKMFGTSYFDSVSSVVTNNDGSIVIAGESNGNVLVMKLSSDGSILWQKTYDNNGEYDYGDSVFKVADGYLVTGVSEGNLIIFKIGEDGSLITSKKIQVKGVIKTVIEEDNGYVLGGGILVNNNADGVMFKISKNLSTLIWQYKYGSTGNEAFFSIKKVSNGYVGVGISNMQFDSNGELTSGKIWVLKTDINGSILWQKSFGDGIAKKVVETIDGGYIIGALGVFNNNEDILLIKLSSDGRFNWAKNYDSGGSDELMDLVIDGSGNIIVAGMGTITNNPKDALILKISSTDGSIIWQKYIDSGHSGDEAVSVAIFQSSYIVTGTLGLNNQDIFIAKIANDGIMADSGCGIYKDANLNINNANINSTNTSVTKSNASLQLNNPMILVSNGSLSNSLICPALFYSLNITITGSGMVTSSPSGISCDNTGSNNSCLAYFLRNTDVTLYSSADNSRFAGWGGDCASCGINSSCVININAHKRCTANYISIYYVYVSAEGNGIGSVQFSPGDFSFNYPQVGGGAAAFDEGTNVILTGRAEENSTVSWINCPGTISGNNTSTATCTITNLNSYNNAKVRFDIKTYTVTPIAGTGGTIEPSISQQVTHGSTINVTATANTGYHIVSITGCGINYANTSNDVTTYSTTATITSDCTVTAIFALNTYNLSVIKTGTGTGSVNAEGCTLTWIGNTATCTATFGMQITLKAKPFGGSVFSGWSNGTGSVSNCSGSGDCVFTISADSGITATFDTSSIVYNLTVNKSGTGTGTVTSTPTGISCGSDCTNDYPINETVLLTATPGADSWIKWGGDCTLCGTNSTCGITMDASKSCTANFKKVVYLKGTQTQREDVTTSTSVQLYIEPIGQPDSFMYHNGKVWSKEYQWSSTTLPLAITVPGGDGVKEVYVRINEGGVWREYKTSILLDTKAPTGSVTINDGEPVTNSTTVTLNLNVADVQSYSNLEVLISNDKANWQSYPYSSAITWTILGVLGINKVYVKFKDSGGKSSPIYTASIIYNPTLLTVIKDTSVININYGGLYTNKTGVILTINAPDVSYTQMRLGQVGSDGNIKWGGYSNIELTKTYSLTGADGIKRVYIQFRDANGSESNIYYDDIILDRKKPNGIVIINDGAYITKDRAVQVKVIAIDEQSGVDKIEISLDNTNWDIYDESNPDKRYILQGDDGVKNVYVRITDKATNISSVLKDSIILDTTSPTGVVKINGGKTTTTSTQVTLNITANGAVWMKVSVDGGLSYGEWESYKTTKVVELPSGAGEKVVSVIFKDLAGNESFPISATITLIQ